jgi:hypothetical protein
MPTQTSVMMGVVQTILSSTVNLAPLQDSSPPYREPGQSCPDQGLAPAVGGFHGISASAIRRAGMLYGCSHRRECREAMILISRRDKKLFENTLF